jgi:formylglycine-generating enzyme required for sulfatase activity
MKRLVVHGLGLLLAGCQLQPGPIELLPAAPGEQPSDPGVDAGAPDDGGTPLPPDAGVPDAGADGGVPSVRPSCRQEPRCGGQSCCDEGPVLQGAFPMGRGPGLDAWDGGSTSEEPEHTANLGPFSLETYEVTVGRFREYVANYPGPPAPDAGAQAAVPGSGWQSTWDSRLPATGAALANLLSCGSGATWTVTPGPREDSPINCVSWYEAFAFCAWDGRELPTEAQWELTAAGAQENRLFPWGQGLPTASLATYESPGGPVAVGSHPAGAGRWGQLDLGGNVAEWVLDAFEGTWYLSRGNPCNDCSALTGVTRGFRGGAWNTGTPRLRAASRTGMTPDSRSDGVGLRCVRTRF